MLGALGEDGGVQPGIKGWAGSECLGRGTHLTARVSPNKTPPLPVQVIKVLGREQRGLDRSSSSSFRVDPPPSLIQVGKLSHRAVDGRVGVRRHLLRAQAAKQSYKYNPGAQVLAMQTARRARRARLWQCCRPPLPALR